MFRFAQMVWCFRTNDVLLRNNNALLCATDFFIFIGLFEIITLRGEPMESIWNTIKKPKFSAPIGDVKTDVLIIGGGMCGLLCA